MADYNSSFTGQQVDTAVQKTIDLTTASRINTAVTKSEALDSATDINNAVAKVNVLPSAVDITNAVNNATKVVANETLAGGESNLTEITIGTTKYAVPSPSTPANMVTTDTAQTISANKSFRYGAGLGLTTMELNCNGYINKVNDTTESDTIKINGVSFIGGGVGSQYVGCQAGTLTLRTGIAPVVHTTLNGNNYNMIDSSMLPNYPQLASIPAVPSENGTYTLKATRSGSNVTYSWVLDA